MTAEVLLGDALEALIDYRGKTPRKLGSDFSDAGVPVVSANNVRDGRLDLEDVRFVTPDVAAKWMSTTTRKGDVILTSEAPVGRVARVPSDEPLVLGQRLFGLRGRHGVLDNGFLYYALQTDEYQQQLEGRSTGTTVLGIRQSALVQVRMKLPSLNQQAAIADVLGALDDKIAANTRVVRATDGLCEALFDQLLADEDATLSSIAAVNDASVKPGNGELRYLDISSVAIGTYAWPEAMEWAEAPGRARRLVRPGDTVWSTVRPNRRSHALIFDEDLVGSTGLAVITPTAAGPAFVYQATNTPEFTAYLEAVAEGSAYPAVRSDRFLEAPVRDVRPRDREHFESVAYPARVRAHAAAVESRQLASLRDNLLPHLMSGRITVAEAEKAVEEVL